jgi:hypothetical protein
MESSLIRKKLKPFFSFWKSANIILTDPEYDDVSSFVLRKAVTNINAKGDCDDYSRELWCRLRHLNPQWPVGICLLNKVSGEKTNHAMVVSVCVDGVYLVEPQAVWDIGMPGMQRMWEANPFEDRFYFIYI